MVLFALWFGATTASLVCLLVGRRASGEVVATKHSHCECGRELHLYEVVPVVPWLACRGRARCCGARIPGRWPLLELGLAITWAVATGLGLVFGLGLIVVSTLVVALLEDRAVTRLGQRRTRSGTPGSKLTAEAHGADGPSGDGN